MTSEKQTFINQIAPYAMEEQIKYGIPASVTISQAIFESKYGLSPMAKECHNLFGIKANSSWLSAGKPYGEYDDDRPNEKFCKYSGFQESIDHHSRILMDGRYMQYCKNLSPTDYMGWFDGLQKGGYATKKDYAAALSGDIKPYKLYEYDQKAMEMAAQRGVQCGYMRGQASQPSQQVSANNSQANAMALNDGKTHLSYLSGNFAMPVDFSVDGVKVTGKYLEQRRHPDHLHGGLDIATAKKSMELVATEDNGVVKQMGKDNSRGNFIIVEYTRQDSSKIRCTYMHLNNFENLKEGDKVKAGTILGKSGDSGRSSGIHLHFEVEKAESDGTYKPNHGSRIDPAQYLAELQVRTGQNIALKAEGQSDYLASAKSKMVVDRPGISQIQGDLAQKTNSNDPKKWLQYLQEQNNDLDHSKDLFSSLLSHYFTNAFLCLVAIKDQEESIRLDEEIKASDAKEKSRDVFRPLEKVDGKAAAQTAAASYNEIVNQEAESQSEKQTKNITLA